MTLRNQTRLITTCGLTFLAFIILGVMVGIAQPQQTQPTAQQAITSTLRQLAACQQQLAPLTNLQADIVAGVYVEAATLQKQIETANPTFTFDPKTFKLTPKPAGDTK